VLDRHAGRVRARRSRSSGLKSIGWSTSPFVEIDWQRSQPSANRGFCHKGDEEALWRQDGSFCIRCECSLRLSTEASTKRYTQSWKGWETVSGRSEMTAVCLYRIEAVVSLDSWYQYQRLPQKSMSHETMSIMLPTHTLRLHHSSTVRMSGKTLEMCLGIAE
jgi:hypothetical protein